MESFKLFSSKINLVYFLLRRRRFSLAACKTNTINFKLESSNYVKYKYLHCSTILNKRRKTAEERKSSRIIEYSPKSKAPIVQVWRYITPIEIAEILKKDIKFVKQLFLNDYVASTEPIEDMTLLHQIIKRSGHRMEIIGKPRDQLEKIEDKDVYPQKIVNKAFLKPRPPVVTIMGHVDHGKTTLLDALRHSSIVEKEFGGITQHIGAFSVRLDSGAEVTFLDTPGHAAFTTMRARGANVTDLVVLVVAADDGVMEQTIESVKMAKSAKVPILVAINKIDSPKADIERTKRMLQEIDLHVEDLGGDVQTVAISALKRQNLDLLVEALVLQAELLEIKADYNRPAEAVVIESRVDPNRGKLCTLIVKRGTLKKGTILVSNTVFAKIRAMRDAENKILKEVSPGYCAEIEGWKDLPESGDIVLEVESEKRAKEVIHVREMKERLKKEEQDKKVIIQKADEHRKVYEENLQLKRRLGRVKRLKPDGPRQPEFEKDDRIMLNLIIKGDVHGSVEAIIDTLDTYDSNLCDLDLIHSGVGTVTENDVELAQAFNAIIYAFNLNYSDKIQQLADESGVTIKSFNVIYKLVDSVKEELNTKIPPVEIEEICGEAQVLQQFEIDQGKKKIPIAGCKCVKGTLKKSGIYKLIRNGDVIYTGSLSSLRHLKNEVDTIKTNTECGLQLVDKTVTFQPGDTLLYVEKVLRSQEINWDPGF